MSGPRYAANIHAYRMFEPNPGISTMLECVLWYAPRATVRGGVPTTDIRYSMLRAVTAFRIKVVRLADERSAMFRVYIQNFNSEAEPVLRKIVPNLTNAEMIQLIYPAQHCSHGVVEVNGLADDEIALLNEMYSTEDQRHDQPYMLASAPSPAATLERS